MASRWPTVRLGDVAAKSPNALVGGPFGSNLLASERVESGVPVIQGANMSSGRWLGGPWVYVADEKADSLAANVARFGDIIFTQRGTVGQVALVPNAHPRYVVSQSQMKLTPDLGIADALYLYYWFSAPAQVDYARSSAIQTGVPHTNLGILRDSPVALPPLDEQRKIAGILGALDDKIELNRKTSRTLDQVAGEVFKSWFVDFHGRDDVAEESALGTIPAGWSVREIGDVCTVTDCLHSKKPERQDSGPLLLQLSNIRDDGLLDVSDAYKISDDDYRKWTSKFEAREGDCVITNVGRIGAVSQVPPSLTAAPGRNMTGVRPRPEFPYPSFLVELLRSTAMRGEIELKTDSGTIMDALNVRSIPRLRFVLPDSHCLEEFERLVRPVRRRMELALSESSTLGGIRAALLPRLLSGELRVPDAEKVVEGVM